MSFGEKIREYFNKKGMTNREISQTMEGYSESLISRYLNSDNLSATFLEKLVKYFPDIDFNYLLKEDAYLTNEELEKQKNAKESVELLNEISDKLAKLKEKMPQ